MDLLCLGLVGLRVFEFCDLWFYWLWFCYVCWSCVYAWFCGLGVFDVVVCFLGVSSFAGVGCLVFAVDLYGARLLILLLVVVVIWCVYAWFYYS